MIVPDFWQGRRIFLTGHSGFKGSWLSLLLDRLQAKVTGYALPPPTQPSLFDLASVEKRVKNVTGDIRDLAALKQAVLAAEPEVVLHLAAQPLVRESYLDPIATYASNVMGTAHMLEAVRQCPSVKVVLVITTDKCYENVNQIWGYRETDRLGGHDPYSSSKACAELVVAAFRSSFFSAEQAPAIASARAGNVIGGGDWAKDRLIPDLMRAFQAGEPAVIRFPNAVRPWQHVLEPLTGYLMLCEKLWQGGTGFEGGWNFGQSLGDAQSVSYVTERVAALWGDKAAWRVDGNDHPHEAHFLYLDASMAQLRLGHVPQWGLERALQETVSWYRACAKGADMAAFTLGQIDDFLEQGKH